MTPADLDALLARHADTPRRCCNCTALAAVRCRACRVHYCGECARSGECIMCFAPLVPSADADVATLARALWEAWAERDAQTIRAHRASEALYPRNAILSRAGAKLGWPSHMSSASYWADMMERAIDETAATISRLENLVAQARESYPRAEVLRVLDAAGVEGVGIVDRVRRLVSDRDALREQLAARERLAAGPGHDCDDAGPGGGCWVCHGDAARLSRAHAEDMLNGRGERSGARRGGD